MAVDWSDKDKADLAVAVRNLEVPSFMTRATDVIGTPIEKGIEKLPEGAQAKIAQATRLALDKALSIALLTMQDNPQREASPRIHMGAAAAAGAVGGFFGFAALLAELPITTGIMLRSIADIARAEGEDLRDPECAVACLEVFALGSPSTKEDDGADIGYFAVRAALAGHIRHAVKHLAEKGAVKEGAPAVVRAVTAIAARFNVNVTDKAMLQFLPVLGAASGALINTLFISSYQDIARGHFTVRRLERLYGAEDVRIRYDDAKSNLKSLPKPEMV